MSVINVLDFGADNLGKTESTKAIQSAIDSASKKDTVFLPSGTFISGTLKLKSDITLKLDKNAILYGVCDYNGYKDCPRDIENRYCDITEGPYGVFPKKCFLCFNNVKDVTVTGGKIMFNDLFFDTVYANAPLIVDEEYVAGVEYFKQPSTVCVPKSENRPFAFYILKSKNIKITDIEIDKSPVYSVWTLNSENIVYDGIKIRNSKYQWNGDGLHFSSCHNIEIKNCDIVASDDCIAIDGNYGKQSYNFNIHDNVLYSTIHCIRLYTGLDFSDEETCHGDYEKFSVHDIMIKNNEIINAVTALLVCAFDGNIYNVNIDDLSGNLEFEGTTLSINAKAGRVYNLTINNCKFNCNGIAYICADNNGQIDGLEFINCSFIVTPKTKFWGDDFSLPATHGYSMPIAFVINNADVSLKGVQISFNRPKYLSDNKAYKKLLIDKLGKKRLSEIESKYIKAIRQKSGNLKIKNCDINDYGKE